MYTTADSDEQERKVRGNTSYRLKLYTSEKVVEGKIDFCWIERKLRRKIRLSKYYFELNSIFDGKISILYSQRYHQHIHMFRIITLN